MFDAEPQAPQEYLPASCDGLGDGLDRLDALLWRQRPARVDLDDELEPLPPVRRKGEQIL